MSSCTLQNLRYPLPSYCKETVMHRPKVMHRPGVQPPWGGAVHRGHGDHASALPLSSQASPLLYTGLGQISFFLTSCTGVLCTT